MTRVSASVGLAISLVIGAACDRTVTSPTLPAAQPVPQPTYTLSGVVYIETAGGREPAEFVRVDEGAFHRSARTDLEGRYTLSGLSNGSLFVTASGAGIAPSSQTVMISGDTKLDIRVTALASFTLSGVVFERTETGTAPIEGVDVYCDSCGSRTGHTSVYTDANGFYSFSYTYPGINPLLIRKAGYGDPPGQPPSPSGNYLYRRPMVNGDTKFDIELVRQ